MTFAAKETGQETGNPVTLYHIIWGDQPTNFYAYCDADVPITYQTVTYEPTVIGREAVEESSGLDNKNLEIDITPNASIVQLYKTKRPSQVVTLTIYAGHVDDTEFVVAWTGRILAIDQEDKFAKITAEPISTSMRRPGLRRNYQYGCPWALYSTECGANPLTLRVQDTPSAVGDTYIEFADGWQQANDPFKYLSGYLSWSDPLDGSTQIKTIYKVEQDTPVAGTWRITIGGGTVGLTITDTVSLHAGCNHQLDGDCTQLHNNANNFGGQWKIPKINPIGFNNQFY